MTKIADQTDVRTRGGKTTVKLTGAGNATLKRLVVLLDELGGNPAIRGKILKAVEDCVDAANRLVDALDDNGASPDPASVAPLQSIEESKPGENGHTPAVKSKPAPV